MKKLEKILGILFLVALVLKFNLIIGGNLLVYLSLVLLALIYYPLGFVFFNDIPLKKVFKKAAYKGLSGWRIIGTIFLGMAFSGICFGTLFKLVNWPDATLNLTAGLGTLFIVFIIALIHFLKSKNDLYKGLFKRMAIIGGFGLIMALTPQINLVKLQFRNHPRYIEAYEKFIRNPTDKELRIKHNIEYLRATRSQEEFELYMKLDYPGYPIE
ncbi:MAG: hypothetical protein CVU09_01525 [Bacteroidetes bacterium HGW-Bacteroidetes-4]|jgi:hypothetical protein|nr:MAG: hypothetical protein CVU09_01525 [Bacteroidetes bacterium HGW-Bacteroidetes-4]